MAVTADEVRTYRDHHGVGMFEAKRVLRQRDIDARLEEMRVDLRGAGILDSVSTKRALFDLIDIVREVNQ